MSIRFSLLLVSILCGLLIFSDATSERSRRSVSAKTNDNSDTGSSDSSSAGGSSQGSNSGEGSSSKGSNNSASNSSEGSPSSAGNSSSGEKGDGDSFNNLKNNETNEYDETYWKSFISPTDNSESKEESNACGSIVDRYCFNAPSKCTDIGGVLDDDYPCPEGDICCDLSDAE